MKKTYSVEKTFSGMRIDRWIRNSIKKIPQGLIEKNLRKGSIKVNGKKIKSSYKIKENDQIIFYNLEFKDSTGKEKYKFIPSKDVIKSNEKLIIDNNDNFIVLNKSSGVSVQGGTKSKKNLVDIFSNSKIYQLNFF